MKAGRQRRCSSLFWIAALSLDLPFLILILIRISFVPPGLAEVAHASKFDP
jgi:hypothetical protein